MSLTEEDLWNGPGLENEVLEGRVAPFLSTAARRIRELGALNHVFPFPAQMQLLDCALFV